MLYLRGGKIISGTYTVYGVGGIGSWVAVILALIGADRLVLVDPDIVEEHNLNRTLYRYQDIGKHKVFALAEIIKSMRPGMEIEAYPCTDKEVYGFTGYKVHCIDNDNLPNLDFPVSVSYDGDTLSLIGYGVADAVMDSGAHSYYTDSNAISSILGAWLTVSYHVYKKLDYTSKLKNINIEEVLNV